MKEAPVNIQEVVDKVTTNQIAFALTWLGRANTDLDLWTLPEPGEAWVYWAMPRTRQAVLHRDVRTAQTDQASFDSTWFERSEVTVVNHSRLSAVEAWINAYAAAGDITGRVLVVWKGRRAERPFRFEAVVGDRASNQSQREHNPAWQRIDLSALFPEAFANHDP